MNEIPKNYDFKNSELKWQKFWNENKLYKSNPNKDKPKFSVVIPPPNVTGILHFGHILNNTIQDLYCRWKRMQGYEVCWVPGMDHAGIATQMVVENELAKDNRTKYDLGREKFIELVWEWKKKNRSLHRRKTTIPALCSKLWRTVLQRHLLRICTSVCAKI